MSLNRSIDRAGVRSFTATSQVAHCHGLKPIRIGYCLSLTGPLADNSRSARLGLSTAPAIQRTSGAIATAHEVASTKTPEQRQRYDRLVRAINAQTAYYTKGRPQVSF